MPLLQQTNSIPSRRPVLYRSIGERMYVGSGELRQLHLIGDEYYVVVDEIRHQVKKYIWDENRRMHVIDWDSQVESCVGEEIFR